MDTTVKRDFNGAAHFFLGLSMFAAIMAIITSALNISNYKFFGIGNTDVLIIEIVMDALILVAGILTFMKKPYGLIALVLLFIIRMFATVNYSSSLSVAGQLGGKTALLIRDFGLFAIAMCFKKNGISGWKSMLASEEYVIAHTTKSEAINESIAEAVVNDVDLLKPEDIPYMPKESDSISPSTGIVPPQMEGDVVSSVDIEKPIEKVQKADRPKKSPFKSLSKLAKMTIASSVGLIVVCAIMAIIVATKSYPDYITSYGDKWKYSFNLPNDNLVVTLMEKAQPKGDDVYFVLTHPKFTSSVFSAQDFYRVRIDIHREQPGSTFYYSTNKLTSPQELKDKGIYVSIEDGEYDVLDEEADIEITRKYWTENNTLDGEVIWATKKYDYDAALKDEMLIVDQAASIPVKKTETIELVGGYYENELNYSKAADYYQFLLKKYPRNSAIRGHLAYALALAGELEEARICAEKALSKDPKNIKALASLSIIESEEYNWGEVKKYARKAIDYGSEDSNVFYAYCEALYKQGEIDAAHQYYNKAYESYRHNPRRGKYSVYAGCPFDVISIDFASIKGSKTYIDYGEKLISSKCYYISPRITANYYRYESAEIGVKFFENGKLSTGAPSKNGFSYMCTMNGKEPGEREATVLSWGSDSPGVWSPGYYSFEIWYKNEKIGEESFRVY